MTNFWDGGGSVHKINKFDMSEVCLCPFIIVLLSHKGRERLKIVTTIFVRKIDTRRGGYRLFTSTTPTRL
jgi:hypothetical protein